MRRSAEGNKNAEGHGSRGKQKRNWIISPLRLLPVPLTEKEKKTEKVDPFRPFVMTSEGSTVTFLLDLSVEGVAVYANSLREEWTYLDQRRWLRAVCFGFNLVR